MSVAHDFDPMAQEHRIKLARALVDKTARQLARLRLASAQLETHVDPVRINEVRAFAEEVVRAATPLELPLLVACAKEVLDLVKGFDVQPPEIDLSLYVLSALDTVGMELERLRHDRDLR